MNLFNLKHVAKSTEKEYNVLTDAVLFSFAEFKMHQNVFHQEVAYAGPNTECVIPAESIPQSCNLLCCSMVGHWDTPNHFCLVMGRRKKSLGTK
jgi:hypothetical protein